MANRRFEISVKPVIQEFFSFIYIAYCFYEIHCRNPFVIFRKPCSMLILFLNCKIKTESPLWFLSNEGMLFLKRQQKLMHCELPQSKATAPLNKDKIGEDLKINKKNNNILDFIRDGKNKES